MLTIPTYISLLRAPLALLFLLSHPLYRSVAIVFAMISDGLDGYLARRYQVTTALGTLLDPIMDKFFVAVALTTFFLEGRLGIWELAAMGCRDFSVFLFGFYLLFNKQWKNYPIRAFWCGKITTCLQFAVLLALTWDKHIPHYIYSSFLLLGICALIELYVTSKSQVVFKHEI
jgi:phosphatidylglycerophosphate synthase